MHCSRGSGADADKGILDTKSEPMNNGYPSTKSPSSQLQLFNTVECSASIFSSARPVRSPDSRAQTFLSRCEMVDKNFVIIVVIHTNRLVLPQVGAELKFARRTPNRTPGSGAGSGNFRAPNFFEVQVQCSEHFCEPLNFATFFVDFITSVLLV